MEIMQSEFFCILQQEASNLSKMRILSDAFTVKNRACKGPQLGPCYLINSHDLLRRHVSSLVRKLPTNFFVYKFQRSMNIFMRAQKMVCFEGYTEFLVVVEAVFFFLPFVVRIIRKFGYILLGKTMLHHTNASGRYFEGNIYLKRGVGNLF